MQMIEIDWEKNGDELTHFEAAFTTDRIYRVESRDFSFALVETNLPIVYSKRYAAADIAENFKTADYAAGVIDNDRRIVGFITAEHEIWNRSVRVSGLFVADEYQRRGVGRKLLAAAHDFARAKNASRLRLETQNVNYPAIRFYLRHGFRLCGLDESLYDPLAVPDETALFFSRPV